MEIEMTRWTAVDCSCPSCGEKFNRLGDPEDKCDAEVGAFSVCLYCAALLTIKKDWTPELADPARYAKACQDDPSLRKYIEDFRTMIREANAKTTKH